MKSKFFAYQLDKIRTGKVKACLKNILNQNLSFVNIFSECEMQIVYF